MREIELRLQRASLAEIEGKTDAAIIGEWLRVLFIQYAERGADAATHLALNRLLSRLGDSAEVLALDETELSYVRAVLYTARPPGSANEIFSQLLRLFG